MYLQYFGLEQDPFTISPDPAFLYPSPQHRQALAHLKYGLDREGGFILLTGEVGTGKTTLTRLLLEQLPGNIRVAYILNAKLNSEDVLASICQDLSLEHAPGASIKTLTDLIYKDLLEAHSQARKTLLVLEEAQNLDPDVLETLRLLTNLETNTAKLLHILLVGQPELQQLLARNELRQLNQRVVSRFHIEPLDLPETINYLNHRLRHAGSKRPAFDAGAIKRLHKLSGGIPRMLNLLAERSMLGAYATHANLVNAQIVQDAHREVLGDPNPVSRSPQASVFGSKAIFSAVIVVALIAVGLYVFLSENSSQSVAETAKLRPQTQAQEVPEPIQELEQSAPEPPAVVEPERNAYEQLLYAWGVDQPVTNQRGFCQAAAAYELSCRTEQAIGLADLTEINRPGLVSLPGEQDNIFVYLLSAYDGRRVTLMNSSGSIEMSARDFARVWDGSYLYIWRPPSGYLRPLYPGARNASLVRWAQEKLEAVLSNYEYVIGGGVYSQPIVRSVARFQSQQGLETDGLLGPRTILRLMDLTEVVPQLDNPQSSVRSESRGP